MIDISDICLINIYTNVPDALDFFSEGKYDINLLEKVNQNITNTYLSDCSLI